MPEIYGKFCGEHGKIFLALSDNGCLYTSDDNDEWERLDFNQIYKGYYPECVFTAIAYCKGVYYVAGTDAKGNLHLFSSLMCGVWERVRIRSFSPTQQQSDKCISILYHMKSEQVLLVCRSGIIITLPDCPRCVISQKVWNKTISEAVLENEEIVAKSVGGEILRVPVNSALQYRISRQHAAKLVQRGAKLIDLCPDTEYTKPIEFEQSISLTFETLHTELRTNHCFSIFGAEDVLVFYCILSTKSSPK